MREIVALLRASWLAALSYRINMLISLASLAATVVPIYFVSRAVQPIVADSIQTEGGQYFAFLLVGMIAFSFLSLSVGTLPGAISSGIGNGTFEALLSTPARLPALMAGFMSYGFLWTGVRAVLLIVVGSLLGATFAWGKLPLGFAIIFLIVLAHVPFGILSAAFVLAFRTPTPLGRGVLLLSGLLGGVYYSTTVIPSWLQDISAFLPLTYGLRALRRTVLEGMSIAEVAPDIAVLTGLAVLLLAGSSAAFLWALGYARRAGTLSHY